ncbi:hypothetical protein B0A52_07052 [Exophiala mesophila]|uniref:D-xylose reductase [NAD(P)H] n=1 Tax=Exophiala mesophila TaxID=212818 RepID=A0A438MY03_EXOME|nr:hypothetical protein B0A52_07052 [Exophiala mesophila]
MGSYIEPEKVFTLNTGASIPAFGLGTHLAIGARRDDQGTYFYGNEESIGKALKEILDEGVVDRKDLFITTKLWCTYHTRVEEALDKSLQSLGLDFVDLYLMHWPIAMNANGNHDTRPMKEDGSRDLDTTRSHVQTYHDMEKLLATGKVKAIGVANYSVGYLKELLANCSVIPAVCQVELHPRLPQEELVAFCRQHGIHNTAYSPLGSSGAPLISDPVVQTLSTQKGVPAGNILLNYHVERGCSVLPKSVDPTRIAQNRQLVPLSKSDMLELSGISSAWPKRFLCPDFAGQFGWTDTK